MEVLLVHPNFPGQFRRIASHLARTPGVHVVGVGDDSWMSDAAAVPDVSVIRYPAPSHKGVSTHPYTRKFDEAVRRGQQVIQTLTEHKQQGLEPDVILAHPGWGDAFFLRDFFPGARVIGLFEYFYHPRGADVGFDPESPSKLDDIFRLRILNATQLLALDSCDEGYCPTAWQRGLFPARARDRLSVIHEGIDTTEVRPGPEASVTLPDGTVVNAGDEVLTFVSRNLEPYRGYHVLMRALPDILRERPQCRVLIVGGDGSSYGPKPPAPLTHRQKYLDEVADRLDLSRVHFLGRLPYADYLKVLQVSRLHVYLTYPFILSWSMLEAMAAGCLVLASATPPVQEVIADGDNGMLFPFLSHDVLARRAIEALADPAAFASLREQARQTVVQRYDFETVSLPAYMRMLKV